MTTLFHAEDMFNMGDFWYTLVYNAHPSETMFSAHRAHTVYSAPLHDSAGRRIVVAIVWSANTCVQCYSRSCVEVDKNCCR